MVLRGGEMIKTGDNRTKEIETCVSNSLNTTHGLAWNRMRTSGKISSKTTMLIEYAYYMSEYSLYSGQWCNSYRYI